MSDPMILGCGCEDCEAAVSPGAYLVTLLDYAVKHVRRAGGKIDVAFLETRFHQPFSRLPIDCELTAKLVNQVRLAVEVLRQYVGPRPVFEPDREARLAGVEADYRLAVYTQLLTRIGTNYAEVRQARANAAPDRSLLAERLGIGLTQPAAGDPRHDELDQLFLDPAEITERTLERLFGFAETTRERLSEGTKYGDPRQQFVRWNLNGAKWDRNTNALGLVYLDLYKLDATVHAVRVFRDAARTQIVASGQREGGSGPIRLGPEGGSGLTGVVDIDYEADEADVAISVVPLLQTWRLRHLRTLWLGEDTAAAAANAAPLIDPQVIGLGDIASTNAGVAAYDLWLARTQWLGDQRAAIQATRAAAADPLAGFEAIVAQALGAPGHAVTAADLDSLDAAQRQGQRIEDSLAAIGLRPAGFSFLRSVRDMVRGGQPVIELEWATVVDTLLFACKQNAFPAWRAEERAMQISLSPQHFQPGEDAPGQVTNPATPFWLSTAAVRRAWLDVLDARIAQQATVETEIQTAVSDVEATALPILRNALIEASDAVGDTRADRADWLAHQLLIDFRMSGTERTTRVAQAIETLQELLFGLRTGQIEQKSWLDFAPLQSIFAVPQGAERINLFGRGSDGMLWHRVWNGTWRNWVSLGPLPGAGGGMGPSDPVAMAHPDGRLDVVVRGGADRVLWRKRYDQGWGDWLRVSDDLELTGNLTVAAREPGQFDVFGLRISDLRVMQRHTDGATWTAWQDTGAHSTRTPASASSSVDRVDLILSLSSPDLFKPMHRWWDGAWHDAPLDSFLFSDPVATGWRDNRVDVFQNYAGHLWQKTWNVGWGAWIDLDGALPPGSTTMVAPPAVYSSGPDTLEVFALRGSSVWRRRLVAGAWSDWEEIPSGRLELDAPDFDAEWEWIGSYSTYRAATFVRLYPENLLLPSLVTHQTPAFARLVAESRPSRPLSPDDACRLAQGYSTYIRDVSFLDIRATCQAATRIAQNAKCKTATYIEKDLCYMFARQKSGRMYWSAWNPDDRSGYALSFWDEVPLGANEPGSVKVVEIIGALPWVNRDNGHHHIYVFVDVDELGIRRLKRLRFDLDAFGREPWDSDAQELGELPRWTHPSGQIRTSAVNEVTLRPVQSNSVLSAPRLAVHLHRSSQLLYIRPINATGDDWEGAAWDAYEVKPRYWSSPTYYDDQVVALGAALSVGGTDWVVYSNATVRRAYAKASGTPVYYDVSEPSARLRGALPGSADNSIFLFYEEVDQVIYREFRKTAGAGAVHVATAGMTTLAPHSGSYSPFFFVMQKSSDYAPTFAYRCRPTGGRLMSSFKLQVVPRLASEVGIPCGGTVASLQTRRNRIKTVYEENKGASASILTYLAEAYRLVPVQLGLNMQAARQFRAALDWFLTVYDYRAPQGQRYIDYGLAIDAGLPETAVFLHPEDWLLDPLNPHAIALTRRLAQTRHVIAAIIRCFNEFGDAEFTIDTDESLVRARMLYTTALELCDTPEMQQRLGACAELIGALRIAPGENVPPEVAAALGQILDDLAVGGAGSSTPWMGWLEKMKTVIQSGQGWGTILPQLNDLKIAALREVQPPMTSTAVTAERKTLLTKAYSGLLTDPAVEKAAKLAGQIAVAQAAAAVTAGEG